MSPSKDFSVAAKPTDMFSLHADLSASSWVKNTAVTRFNLLGLTITSLVVGLLVDVRSDALACSWSASGTH